MELKQIKYLGKGKLVWNGVETTILLTRIDIKNDGFAGVADIFGAKVEIRNTLENGLLLSQIAELDITPIAK